VFWKRSGILERLFQSVGAFLEHYPPRG